MTIEDVNVLVELRHFMRTNGWYDEYQLNPRLFQCPSDIFILLCKKLQDENLEIDKETKENIKALAKTKGVENEAYIGKILSGAAEDGLKELAKTATQDIITEILKLLPFGGVAATAIKYLINAIDRK